MVLGVVPLVFEVLIQDWAQVAKGGHDFDLRRLSSLLLHPCTAPTN